MLNRKHMVNIVLTRGGKWTIFGGPDGPPLKNLGPARTWPSVNKKYSARPAGRPATSSFN